MDEEWGREKAKDWTPAAEGGKGFGDRNGLGVQPGVGGGIKPHKPGFGNGNGHGAGAFPGAAAQPGFGGAVKPQKPGYGNGLGAGAFPGPGAQPGLGGGKPQKPGPAPQNGGPGPGIGGGVKPPKPGFGNGNKMGAQAFPGGGAQPGLGGGMKQQPPGVAAQNGFGPGYGGNGKPQKPGFGNGAFPGAGVQPGKALELRSLGGLKPQKPGFGAGVKPQKPGPAAQNGFGAGFGGAMKPQKPGPAAQNGYGPGFGAGMKPQKPGPAAQNGFGAGFGGAMKPQKPGPAAQNGYGPGFGAGMKPQKPGPAAQNGFGAGFGGAMKPQKPVPLTSTPVFPPQDMVMEMDWEPQQALQLKMAMDQAQQPRMDLEQVGGERVGTLGGGPERGSESLTCSPILSRLRGSHEAPEARDGARGTHLLPDSPPGFGAVMKPQKPGGGEGMKPQKPGLAGGMSPPKPGYTPGNGLPPGPEGGVKPQKPGKCESPLPLLPEPPAPKYPLLPCFSSPGYGSRNGLGAPSGPCNGKVPPLLLPRLPTPGGPSDKAGGWGSKSQPPAPVQNGKFPAYHPSNGYGPGAELGFGDGLKPQKVGFSYGYGGLGAGVFAEALLQPGFPGANGFRDRYGEEALVYPRAAAPASEGNGQTEALGGSPWPSLQPWGAASKPGYEAGGAYPGVESQPGGPEVKRGSSGRLENGYGGQCPFGKC
ncbi:glycine rich extracellular protein 1 [Eptesicus fuscus]|uniref:glycine rich extracellular protein 1 n=1 Tax=Eptesicus fuscus TaxID=29078 RepID=UPI0024046785|nr:glycine rich extracellular protein 1 [Eptesicus fuscus]